MKNFLMCAALFPSMLFAGAEITLEAVKAKLAKMYPNAKVETVRASQMPGLYEALVGMDVVYITSDGQFLIQGEAITLNNKSVNITEETRKKLRIEALKTILPQDEIAFNAPQEKYIVRAFTDTDCGYCRMLHGKVADYNKLGISIRYLAFPRQGLDSPVAKKMEAVWCASNPQEALSKAKADEEVPEKTCHSSMKKDFELGLKLGVNGTPTLLLEDGTVLGGFVEPEKLLQILQHPQ